MSGLPIAKLKPNLWNPNSTDEEAVLELLFDNPLTTPQLARLAKVDKGEMEQVLARMEKRNIIYHQSSALNNNGGSILRGLFRIPKIPPCPPKVYSPPATYI